MIGSTSQLQVVISAKDQASKVFANFQGNLKGYGDKMQSAGRSMTKFVTLPLVGAGVAAVKTAADFDKAMTESVAIMETTIEQEEEMRRVAREVAKSTVASHEEAAKGYFYLASAGLGANEAIAAMPKVAEFAQAGAFDLALATDLLTDAQSALGLTIRDDAVANMENMVKVSDVLVKANTLANATVQQFSEALTSEAGAALKSFNIDIEEGIAVLAAFADQGVKGQVAGSGLSRILRLMTAAANNNKKEMAKLGIEVFDSNGKIRNLADIIENLEDALGGMSDQQRTAALETIGFTARVQGIILPLLGTSDAIRKYDEELRKAGGTTEEIADKQMRSFSNQLGIIKDQILDVAIDIGEIVLPHLVKFMEHVKNLASRFQGLSPTIQKVILAVAGLAAVAGPLLLVFGMMLHTIIPALITLYGGLKIVIVALVHPIKTATAIFVAFKKAVLAAKVAMIALSAHPVIAVMTAIAIAVVLVRDKFKDFADEVGSMKNALLLYWLHMKEDFLANFAIPIVSGFDLVASHIPWVSKKIDNVLASLRKSLRDTRIEFGNLASSASYLYTPLDELPKTMGEIWKSSEIASEGIENLGDQMENTKEDTGSMINEIISGLRKLQDRFWGLEDEETGYLRSVIRLNEERIEALKSASGYTAVVQRREAEGQITLAEQRIRAIQRDREITPVQTVVEWARRAGEQLGGMITGIGATPPELMYPRLEPVSTTPREAVQNFNFNFEGAFIGNPEAFKSEVIRMLNRSSELRSLGGVSG